jgi:hypothetical protein
MGTNAVKEKYYSNEIAAAENNRKTDGTIPTENEGEIRS